MSHPWHGPYRVMSKRDADISAQKVYFPDEGQIQVHKQRITRCPSELLAGYYWYGAKKHSTGGAPKWVSELQGIADVQEEQGNAVDHGSKKDTGDVELEKYECEDEPRDDDEPVSESTGCQNYPRAAPCRYSYNCPYSLRKKTTIPKRFYD